ncbi:MAG: hypothetical protein JWO79_3346 [Actinomycetia bacterium]|jgi:hypothetical protein|nr:hypothetical protein [Actinomycetes bacterium]MDQ1652425.1 hypothetical protein [Cryptosporangiaceae bacterium]MDQ1657564.1 hypothetical protein [Cryptosporangiaceae bacterium]
MRIYLPATLPLVAELQKSGELGPPPLTAFAVTPSLREWYLDEDIEELEYAAFSEAARASLRLIDADLIAQPRRVVISADVPDQHITPHPELDRAVVRIGTAVPLDWLASVHVDSPDAAPDVAAAAQAVTAADLGDEDAQFAMDSAEGHELEWYGVQEIPEILS